ncbi:hypothetical protein ACWOBX_08415 [Facklamia languida]
MKKVINGKRYNTETSTLVGEWENHYSVNDFYWCSEALYQKKTGEFFIHGKGNAASKYSEPFGTNASKGGEKLIPITIDEAKKWVEEKLEYEDYEKLFEFEEELNQSINVLIPVSLYEKLKDRANEDGTTQKNIIVSALEEYL